ARDGEEPGRRRIGAHLLRSAPQRTLAPAERRERGDRPIERMLAIEAAVRRGTAGPEQPLAVVGGHAARQHVLAGVLIAAAASESLLVAVVHDGHPSQREQHGVRQQHAPRSEEHTSELQSPDHLVCRLLLEKKKIAKQRLPSRSDEERMVVDNRTYLETRSALYAIHA